MSVAFIPFYMHFLGNDAFALIGLFVLLQAWLVVLDLVIQWAMAGIIGNNADTAVISENDFPDSPLCKRGGRGDFFPDPLSVTLVPSLPGFIQR